jgi:hypothetical protein
VADAAHPGGAVVDDKPEVAPELGPVGHGKQGDLGHIATLLSTDDGIGFEEVGSFACYCRSVVQ